MWQDELFELNERCSGEGQVVFLSWKVHETVTVGEGMHLPSKNSSDPPTLTFTTEQQTRSN